MRTVNWPICALAVACTLALVIVLPASRFLMCHCACCALSDGYVVGRSCRFLQALHTNRSGDGTSGTDVAIPPAGGTMMQILDERAKRASRVFATCMNG